MPRALPDRFPPAEKSYSLYEGIEYQRYWHDPKLQRHDILEQHIVSDMLPASGRRILDLGCGYGRLASCYLERFDQAVLCDGSLSLLRDARASLGDRAVFVAADLGLLPFKAASFDCVLTIRVLQHVREVPTVLEEVRRVLAGGGQFVFSYHNKRNAKTILRSFAARGSANPFSPEPSEPQATLISRHPKMMGELLKGAGFSKPDYQGTAFVHWFSDIADKLSLQRPAGARWAPFMGSSQLAPWLLGSAFSQRGHSLQEAERADELFQCPICHARLDRSDGGFECSACRSRYPIVDGIFDFRSNAVRGISGPETSNEAGARG